MVSSRPSVRRREVAGLVLAPQSVQSLPCTHALSHKPSLAVAQLSEHLRGKQPPRGFV